MPSNLDLDLGEFQSPYEFSLGSSFSDAGDLSKSYSWSYNPPDTSSFNMQSATSGMTEADASSSMGQAIQSAPSFGSDFMEGMKLGYQGTKMTIAPFLSYRKAKQQKKILGLQQELLEMQAQSYQTAAEDVMRAGHNASASVSYQMGQAKASARTSMAAHGVRVGQGSSAEVLTSYDIAKEMQTNQIIANAVTQSWGYRRQAVNIENQALAVESAKNSISPWASAITSFITESMNSMNVVGSDFGGGQGGIFSGQTWKNFGSFWK